MSVRLLCSSLFVFSLGCGNQPDFTHTSPQLRELATDTLQTTVDAASRSAKLADELSLDVVTLPRIDVSSQAVLERCYLRAVLSEDQWGFVPGSEHVCDDAEVAELERLAAEQWVQRKFSTRTDEATSSLAAFDAAGRFVEIARPSVNKALAMGVSFDLQRCVAERIASTGSLESQKADLRCDVFQDPGYRLLDYRDQVATAATHAQQRLSDSAQRTLPTIDDETASLCSAAVGEQQLAVPGMLDDNLSGGAKAYAIHVFAGETLSLDLISSRIDPVMDLFNGDCTQRLETNDDGGRGRNARIRRSFGHDADVVVVARSLRSGTGEVTLSASVEGRPVLTDVQRSSLERFVTWAGTATDAQLLPSWRVQSDQQMQSACLDSVLLDIGVIADSVGAEAALGACIGELGAAVETHEAALQARGGALGALTGLMNKLGDL